MEAGRVLAGRRPDLTIREWLDANRSTIVELPYVLISSIDSCTDVGAMPWATARRAESPEWALSVSPLVVSGRSVIDLLGDGNLFTGFDELWIPTRLPTRQPPADANLVAPRQLETELPSAVSAWLEGSGCRLGVGDGYGMNYAVLDRDLGADLGLD